MADDVVHGGIARYRPAVLSAARMRGVRVKVAC
jgi:hypothetical protein